jgi:phosphate:Na+ symporter
VTVSVVIGGIGLFLIGMWMMTEGLKIAAGGALQAMLRSATKSPLRGLSVGLAITAVVQSSSAVTVATIGFVNAGLLSLSQSVWVIFGTNVGTTMTGWLVATVGIKVDMVALALPMLGVGMIARLAAGSRPRLAGLGQALAGFGTFFLGIGFLQQGFAEVSVPTEIIALGHSPWLGIAAFLLIGIALTVLTQSSSAAIAIVLTASSGAGLPPVLSAAAVIGTNIGTTSTAVLAALSATPPARRVAGAHIAFNLLTSVVAVILLHPLLSLSHEIAYTAGAAPDDVLALAVFHTLFNCLGILLVWPLAPRLVAWLERRFVNLEEELGRPRHLDPTLRQVPQLALRGILLETARMSHIAHGVARNAVSVGEAADQSDLQGRLGGVFRLGQAVRTFVEDMNKEKMTPEVAGAIPDVIRGIQHLEELARLSAALTRDPALASRSSEEDETGRMRQLVLESLAACDIPLADDASPMPVEQIASDIETLYQALKVSLLARSGGGGMRVEAMERNLARIQQMRRCAEASWKARRRLERWFLFLETNDRPESTPAMPARQDGVAAMLPDPAVDLRQ